LKSAFIQLRLHDLPLELGIARCLLGQPNQPTLHFFVFINLLLTDTTLHI